ncbi:MAG: hypothetical protein KY462_12295 [Actinobacteria bacterium]|nr:hypothetical protein [Actinomycetota bacterium]
MTGGRLPTAVKVLLGLALAAVAIVVLFTWVFPWVEQRMEDPTLETGATGTWSR